MKNLRKKKNQFPKQCSRCGNDLMTGMSIFHLPFEDRYIVFCAVCHLGLGLPDKMFISRNLSEEDWKKFWDKKLKDGN